MGMRQMVGGGAGRGHQNFFDGLQQISSRGSTSPPALRANYWAVAAKSDSGNTASGSTSAPW